VAGNARYTAVLDACVLVPIAMTDALMSLATAGLFAAKWTTRIEMEWQSALARIRPDLTERLDVRRDSMREAVPDWEIPEAAWTSVAVGVTLPDPDDVHVLAAAIAGHADCIVTSNTRDFPPEILSLFGLEAMDPDRFITAQWDLDPLVAMTAFKYMRARWKRPNATAEEFAEALERCGLPATGQRVREAADLI
jgi:predicted nucleic acid-binding protein